MYPIHKDFFAKAKLPSLAICGKYCGGDSIHVGLCWHTSFESKIIHFLNGRQIPVEDALNTQFESYLFNGIDFPDEWIPSLAALSELISENKLNGFVFNRPGGLYDGGKFSFTTGSLNVSNTAERYVNCGVFILALLNTYDITLVNWTSWPEIDPSDLSFLSNWLIENDIPTSEHLAYYKKTRKIRGRHIFVSPSTVTRPSEYEENEQLSQELLNFLSN